MRIDKNRIKVILPSSMSLHGDWSIDNAKGEATIQVNALKVADAQKIQVTYDGAPEPPLSKTLNIKEIVYTVTLKDGNRVIATHQVERNKQFGRPSNPSKAGHTFVNWYNEEGFSNVTTFPFVVTRNINLYARFSINSYTCKVMDGSQVIKTETLNYGTQWTPVQPDKSGFNKKGIFMDSTFNTPAVLPIFVDDNKTVYLKYKDASTVRFFKDKFKLESDLVATLSIDNGSTVRADQIPAGQTWPNLTWGGWGYGSNSSDFNSSVVINTTTDVFGRWTPHSIHFEVKFNANGGMYSKEDGIKVRGTTNAALPFPSERPVLSGKDFVGYALDKLAIEPEIAIGEDVYPVNGTPRDPERTYYAIWKRTPGTVSIDMMSGEASKFKTVTGIEGENILLDGVPVKAGFDFREWAKDPQGNPPTYGPNTNAKVWVVKCYDANQELSSTAYFEGDKVTPEVPVKEGKNFVGWFREPTFVNRIETPFTVNRSIDAFAKFADKVTVNMTYKAPNGKQTYTDTVELGFPYAVTNCLPAFTQESGEPMIIQKWRYMNKGVAEDYYPGQAFPHEVDGPLEFTAIPIEENIVKPDTGIIYLYSEDDITATNPKRKLYSYTEGLDGINNIPQEVATAIVKDYLEENGKAITIDGFTRVTYEQYSGPTSIYTVGDRLSQVGDQVGTFTAPLVTRATKPTYVMVCKYTVGENSALVKFDVAGGKPETIEDQIVKIGTKVKDPGTITKTDAKFKGWTIDGGDSVLDLTTWTVPLGTKSITLTAEWINRYDVEFNTDGGAPNILPVKVYEGELVGSITTPSKAGYTFAGWTYNGDVIDINTWKCPIGGPTAPITAKWTKNN